MKKIRLVCNARPGRTQSSRETLSCSRAEASNTILHFVVSLSARRPAWCGRYRTLLSPLLISYFLCKAFVYILVDPSGVSFSFLGVSLQLRVNTFQSFHNLSSSLISISCSKLWNLLPDNVRMSTSLAAFKNALQTVHLESGCCSFCDNYYFLSYLYIIFNI